MVEVSTEQKIIQLILDGRTAYLAIECHHNRSRGASSQWPVSEDDMFPFLLRFIILFSSAEYRTSTVLFSSNFMWVSQQMYILLTISAEENPPPRLAWQAWPWLLFIINRGRAEEIKTWLNHNRLVPIVADLLYSQPDTEVSGADIKICGITVLHVHPEYML
jgi:hypothetical protein